MLNCKILSLGVNFWGINIEHLCNQLYRSMTAKLNYRFCQKMIVCIFDLILPGLWELWIQLLCGMTTSCIETKVYSLTLSQSDGLIPYLVVHTCVPLRHEGENCLLIYVSFCMFMCMYSHIFKPNLSEPRNAGKLSPQPS